MNIHDARIQIEQAVRSYLKKDSAGRYRIPVSQQRPIFMLGAPGIGKTAIMAQIAGHLALNLVSYTMTHHTRQSALGLPIISERQYDGETVPISEYTMSEIIATIHETIASTGIKEGILFLDEINCVSETLAPAMLEFLQYKVFGRHQVPPGWVIVTAGNPAAYNRTVREFDIATLDRLRVLEVTEDYTAWRLYAKDSGVHGAVLGFLDLKPNHFYHIETIPEGKRYVTARGWDDLSKTIQLYEEEGFPIDRALIDSFIRVPQIAREFSAYYDLYILYSRTYAVADILSGHVRPDVLSRAQNAPFDERLSLIGLLTGDIQKDCRQYVLEADLLAHLQARFTDAKKAFNQDMATAIAQLETFIEEERAHLHTIDAAGQMKRDERHLHQAALTFFDETLRKMSLETSLYSLIAEQSNADDRWNEKENVPQHVDLSSSKAASEPVSVTNAEHLKNISPYPLMRHLFNSRVSHWNQSARTIADKLHHLFTFAENAFGNGEDMALVATELSVGLYSATYLAERPHPDFERHKNHLALERRRDDLVARAQTFQL